MQANMVSVPLPILAAILCAAVAPLMLRLDLGRRVASFFLAALFVDFAVQSLLVGLRFGYGISDYITFQRVLPLSVGPLAYLGFLSLALPKDRLARHAGAHLGVALGLGLALLLFANIYRDFDLVISASYVVYIALLVRLYRRGPDALIHARLDLAPRIVRWNLLAALLIGILLALDTAIAINFIVARGTQAPAMVAFGSGLLIVLLLLILATLPRLQADQGGAPPDSQTPRDRPEDALEAKARALLEETQLYLDPDLNLQRLARRLIVPERALSAAINQSRGMNVSQYVNSFRLTHAAKLLAETEESVTRIMSQSGFLTRSNFYREFQRVYGQSPASYRDAARR